MFLVRYYLQLIDSAAAPLLVGNIYKLPVVMLLLSFRLVLSARHRKRCFFPLVKHCLQVIRDNATFWFGTVSK